MRATVMYEAGDVRMEEVPDARLMEPTDAVVRVTHSCICGSDLWPYKNKGSDDGPARMGHEFIGIVEDAGAEVQTLQKGDLVVAPFKFSDNTCDFCQEGLPTSCRNGGFWGSEDVDGGQGEAVRAPLADGTLVKLPVDQDDALMPSLLTLSDVFSTGHHAAVMAGVEQGNTVAVVGDGAVGVCGVLAARRLGAERILMLGRHTDRTDLAREFGATDVVAERGEEAVEKVLELTGGDGVHSVLECVGYDEALETALGICRAGGAVGRVGVPQYASAPFGAAAFMSNITMRGGIAPARAYIPELLDDVLEGRIEPGKVLDVTLSLDETPEGYRQMNDRESLKVMVKP